MISRLSSKLHKHENNTDISLYKIYFPNYMIILGNTTD